jgi:ABC-type bacteriocin/lantibiotic exporter with double-glycine peptidase domain
MLTALGLFTRHLKGKGALIAALLLLGLAGAATSLATPLIGKTFIDSIVVKGNFSRLPYLALMLLALAGADLLLGVGTRLVHARLSAGVLVEMRDRLFAQCLHAPLAELERFRHGDLLSRFGADIPKIQTLLVDGVLGVMQNLLFLAVAAVILLRLSPALALRSFLGLLVALLFTAAFRTPVERGTRLVRDAMVDLSHFLSERLGALRAIRFHAAQEADQASFAACNARLVRSFLRFQALDAAASGVPSLTLTVALAWIYLLGGRLIADGSISPGTFVAFILYQGRLVSPAMGLLGLVRNLQEARVSLERVAEVLTSEAAPVSVMGRDGHGAGGIDLEQVGFAYSGGTAVLDGVNLRVAEGERVAVFGSSGAGKSTLVQILFGLRTPHQGRVILGRVDSAAGEPRLGYAGSEPFLLHATVAQNLCYGNSSCTEARMQTAAGIAEAHRFISELPSGYDTVIGGRGLALSDGQRQRLGLARLILQDPDILVLDEAFSALDPETEAKVRRNLFHGFSGRTFLVISHRLQGLDDFDRLYLMEGGRLFQVDAEELGEKLGGRSIRQGGANAGKDVSPLRTIERRRCVG